MKKRLIRFGDVRFDQAAKQRVHEVLHTGQNTEGRYVEEFEDRFAKLFNWPYCVVTSSGTTAGEVLWMAVREHQGLDWRFGYTVITPALSFVATANCTYRAGLEPFFADIAPDLNMELPDEPHQPIGVQFVANMGRAVRIDEVEKWARGNGCFFMVDACEAHGAMFNGGDISDYADAAIYSFYPAHIMTCGGEGGAICVREREIYDLCRSIKSHGRPPGTITHDFERIGTNAKWTEMAAACGLSAIDRFEENYTHRRIVREKLLQALKEFPLVLYPDAEGEKIAPHAFPLCVENARDAKGLRAHLDEWTIEWKPLWGALTNHGAYLWLGYSAAEFPNAVDVGERGLHFGCHENISDDDIGYIHDVFKLFFEGRANENNQ